MATVSYPFDPSGSLATNLIQNEEQALSLSNNGYLFLVPFAGPFYKASLKVVLYPGAKILKEGVDYAVTHYFKSASLSCAKPIYGSITFFNKTLAGSVKLSYQTIGGEWVTNKSKALAVLANTLLNPRVAYWEQIADLPYAFPPINHSWSVDTLYGMKEVVSELANITAAIRAKGGTAGAGTSVEVANHLANINNPHQTTKAQVGLGLVANYRIALESEARAGVQNDLYMTPFMTKSAIDALALAPLTAHTAKVDNPHQTTKAQVGLGNVQNYLVATDADVTDGTSDTAYMTPLKTKNMILAVGGSGGGDITKDANGNYIGTNGEFTEGSGSGNLAIGLNALQKAIDGTFNVALGEEAMYDTKGSSFSIGIGFGALRDADVTMGSVAIGWNALSVGTGDNNIAIGQSAMVDNVNSNNNVAIGTEAMAEAGNGDSNVAIGRQAMRGDTTDGIGGWGNVAVGYLAVGKIGSGNNNVGIGYGAAGRTVSGDGNVAIGYNSLNGQTNGGYTIAIGYEAMANAAPRAEGNPTNNVAIGYLALKGASASYNNTGTDNVAIGASAMVSNTTGGYNVAVGSSALSLNTTGSGNIAIGRLAIGRNTTGNGNIALGDYAMERAGIGSENIAIGTQALQVNGNGNYNVALGYYALKTHTTSSNNIAVGYYALKALTDGTDNVAIGRSALALAINVSQCTALGGNALSKLTTGANNTGVGANALSSVTTGAGNTSVGESSFASVSTNYGNTGLGWNAGRNATGIYNTAVGHTALLTPTTGNYNTAVGFSADTTVAGLSYATAIGASAKVATSNTVVLGRTTDVVVIGAQSDAGTGVRLQVTGKASFTDVVTAPTATAGTNTTQVATTAFVTAAVAAVSGGSSSWEGITGKPTTLAGFGITDAQGLSSNLTSIAAIANNVTGYVKITNGVVTVDTPSGGGGLPVNFDGKWSNGKPFKSLNITVSGTSTDPIITTTVVDALVYDLSKTSYIKVSGTTLINHPATVSGPGGRTFTPDSTVLARRYLHLVYSDALGISTILSDLRVLTDLPSGYTHSLRLFTVVHNSGDLWYMYTTSCLDGMTYCEMGPICSSNYGTSLNTNDVDPNTIELLPAIRETYYIRLSIEFYSTNSFAAISANHVGGWILGEQVLGNGVNNGNYTSVSIAQHKLIRIPPVLNNVKIVAACKSGSSSYLSTIVPCGWDELYD